MNSKIKEEKHWLDELASFIGWSALLGIGIGLTIAISMAISVKIFQFIQGF